MEKAKLSRKRCSPLPDIYTLFDKTSSNICLFCYLIAQLVQNVSYQLLVRNFIAKIIGNGSNRDKC